MSKWINAEKAAKFVSNLKATGNVTPVKDKGLNSSHYKDKVINSTDYKDKAESNKEGNEERIENFHDLLEVDSEDFKQEVKRDAEINKDKENDKESEEDMLDMLDKAMKGEL